MNAKAFIEEKQMFFEEENGEGSLAYFVSSVPFEKPNNFLYTETELKEVIGFQETVTKEHYDEVWNKWCQGAKRIKIVK